MPLKVLILISIIFYLGKAQNVEKQPEFTINDKFMNIGPSTIHSIKGKFYEEKQREIVAKPKTQNTQNEEETIENPDANIASQLHRVLTNISNTELPKQGDKILHRRNKGSSINTREPMSQTVDIQNAFNDTSKKLQTTQENKLDSSMRVQAENLVSSYDKNNTIETIKKELAFDSLFIKNDFNNNFDMPPTNIMDTYISHELNSGDVVSKPIMMRVEGPTRRLETGLNYEPPPPNPYHMPIMDENSFMPFTNNGNNIPSNANTATSMPLRENNRPTIEEYNNVIPITPKFHFTNEGNNVVKNIKMDATVPLNNSDVIDKSPNCVDKESNDRESDEILERSGNVEQSNEPTKGLGISKVGKSRVMLMDHPRVCYACSSINDPSCWSPGRITAVKYCRTDHPSCITKLYKYKGLSYIIRDCGNNCDKNVLAGGPTRYTSCTICHHDLCNGAHRFQFQNITILMLLIFHLPFVVERLC